MPNKNNLRKTACGKTLASEYEKDVPQVPRIEIESQQKQLSKPSEKSQSSSHISLTESTPRQKSPIPSPKTIRYNLQPKVEVKMNTSSSNQSLPEFLAKSPIPSPYSTLRRTGFKIKPEEDSKEQVTSKSPQNGLDNRKVENDLEESKPLRISEVIRSLENFDLDNLLEVEKTIEETHLENNGKIEIQVKPS